MICVLRAGDVPSTIGGLSVYVFFFLKCLYLYNNEGKNDLLCYRKGTWETKKVKLRAQCHTESQLFDSSGCGLAWIDRYISGSEKAQ